MSLNIPSHTTSRGNILPTALIAGVVVAISSIVGVFWLENEDVEADIRLLPNKLTAVLNEPTTVTIEVESIIPVNVFAGEVRFDPDSLHVDKIDYNTSVADLWAEKPWYSNGDGTINFAGGTTRVGGFTGAAKLLTITFVPTRTGSSLITLSHARILQHDGLGTDATLAPPIDALLVIEDEMEQKTIVEKTNEQTRTVTLSNQPTTDLNQDGRQTIQDVSIFLLDITTGNERSDFNQDGQVDLNDLSIILQAN